MSDTYLVWSNEHRAWWGPFGWGYVKDVELAGRYTRAEALEICTSALDGRNKSEPLPEIPVREEDVKGLEGC